METIAHTISIHKPSSEVFEAFSSLGGMRSWWTNAISGNPDKGGELKLELGMNRHIVFKVSTLKANDSMALTGISSNFPDGEQVVGTVVTFKVATNAARDTTLTFTHSGWKEKSAFEKAYSKKWLTHIESLKKLCETGKGDPEIVILARK
jgi:uncharacterized protein YndB with AHSA1/START domain